MDSAAVGNLVSVGVWTVGAIATLIVVAVRLSWQASRLNSAVDSGTQAVKGLNQEMKSVKDELKIEVRAIHKRIDDHEKRIDDHDVQLGQLGATGNWSGGDG